MLGFWQTSKQEESSYPPTQARSHQQGRLDIITTWWERQCIICHLIEVTHMPFSSTPFSLFIARWHILRSTTPTISLSFPSHLNLMGTSVHHMSSDRSDSCAIFQHPFSLFIARWHVLRSTPIISLSFPSHLNSTGLIAWWRAVADSRTKSTGYATRDSTDRTLRIAVV